MITVVKGDLLDAKERYICHQTNCVSTNAAGLASAIFRKYPFANVYGARGRSDTPGSILVKGNGKDQRFVVAMFAQILPGRPSGRAGDGFKDRQEYFIQCLARISEIRGLQSVAFPCGIGCGLAGGSWPTYRNILEEFSTKTDAKVAIYMRPGDVFDEDEE